MRERERKKERERERETERERKKERKKERESDRWKRDKDEKEREESQSVDLLVGRDGCPDTKIAFFFRRVKMPFRKLAPRDKSASPHYWQ